VLTKSSSAHGTIANQILKHTKVWPPFRGQHGEPARLGLAGWSSSTPRRSTIAQRAGGLVLDGRGRGRIAFCCGRQALRVRRDVDRCCPTYVPLSTLSCHEPKEFSVWRGAIETKAGGWLVSSSESDPEA
jgi:hypothetical protein